MPISPLNEQQLKALHCLIEGLNDQSTAWLSGYLWGISQAGLPLASTKTQSESVEASSDTSFSNASFSNTPSSAPPAAPVAITLLSASQTGNARHVAQQLHDELSSAGLSVTHTAIGDYTPKALGSEQYVIVVTSTQGEGEPPEEAFAFFKFLSSKKAPQLDHLHFAVLGLGDSTYTHFCQAGKDIDQRLEALGATRLLARVDADVDYDEQAREWRRQVLEMLQQHVTVPFAASSTSPTASLSGGVLPEAVPQAASAWHRDQPYSAPLLVNQKITGRGSDRDVRHIEIDLSGSGLHYTPGDALGVWYENDPALVNEWLNTTRLSGDEPVTVRDCTVPLREALLRHLELTVNSTRLIEHYAEVTSNDTLAALVREGRPVLHAYANSLSPIDLLHQHPPAQPIDATTLTGWLRPLTPRLYSIASSQAEVDDDVHITVGVVRYAIDDHIRTGGASGYLSRLGDNDNVRVFIEHNDTFRLPEDANTPVIMIGPGTGIAPFRAFIQQRAAENAQGRNWLFFGNPHFIDDFLYQLEWQHYIKDGVLDRIDLAWSRDQAQKIYVQDRLREQGADVWQWLRDGAHLYVCGDATHMARDVEATLLTIIQQHGGLSAEDANDYLTTLRAERRYQRDVY